MARLNSKIFVLIASLLFALTTAAQKCPAPTLWDFDDRQVADREYNFWIEADGIARMPDPQRATQIPHVYRDIFADLHKRWYALDNWMILPVRLEGYRKSKAPEPQVKTGFSGYPNMFSQGIALALFIGYPQQTQPLILQDLRSTDPEAISRGIYVAGRMQDEKCQNQSKQKRTSGQCPVSRHVRACFQCEAMPVH